MKTWMKIGLGVLILAVLAILSQIPQDSDPGAKRVDIGDKLPEAMKAIEQKDKASSTLSKALANAKTATKNPGRVVELETSKGIIDFVLFEEDCPLTTARIASLVQKGSYDGVSFPRVENWVIQIDKAKTDVKPMGVELCKGRDWTQAKGTVGMARTEDPNSNTSIFYILLSPAPHLDTGYTNFGRLIKGMDVAMKITKGDMIKHATIRPLTAEDKKLFYEILKIESENRTQ